MGLTGPTSWMDVALLVGVIVAVLVAIAGLFRWLVPPLRRWLGRMYEAGTALQGKIGHERRHFELVQAGKEYKSEDHMKAGDYAFVNLNKSLDACIPWLLFRGPCLGVKCEAKKILAMRQNRRSDSALTCGEGHVVQVSVGRSLSTYPQDVAAFMPLLAKLESRLGRILPLLKIVVPPTTRPEVIDGGEWF